MSASIHNTYSILALDGNWNAHLMCWMNATEHAAMCVECEFYILPVVLQIRRDNRRSSTSFDRRKKTTQRASKKKRTRNYYFERQEEAGGWIMCAVVVQFSIRRLLISCIARHRTSSSSCSIIPFRRCRSDVHLVHSDVLVISHMPTTERSQLE